LLVGLCLGVAIVVGQAEHWLAVASANVETVLSDYVQGVPQETQNQHVANATDAATAAGAGYDLQYVIPGIGLCIAMLVWAGIAVRLREYRYEVT
jgi:hypothetical protein